MAPRWHILPPFDLEPPLATLEWSGRSAESCGDRSEMWRHEKTRFLSMKPRCTRRRPSFRFFGSGGFPRRCLSDFPTFPEMNQEVKTEEAGEIDLLDLLKFLNHHRWKIAASAIGGLSLAGLYAFVLATPVFMSSALLLPVQSQNLDQLGAASALMGKKLGNSGDVDLYQSLLTSRTVIKKLIRTEIAESDSSSKMTPVYQALDIDTSNPIKLEVAIKNLSKSIKVDSKESGVGGILEVKAEAKSPWLAQQLLSSILKIGQEEIRLIRIERTNVIINRLGIAVSQAKSEWDSAAGALTWYKDRNRSIILPDQMLKIAKFEMEKQAKEQKYLLARKEYEMQLLEQAKAAPPMMILDPANYPAKASKPQKKLLLVFGLFAGLFGSCGFLMAFRTLTKAQIKSN